MKTASFYKFIDLPSPQEIRLRVKHICLGLNLKGTILIASEGMNGAVAGKEESVKRFHSALKEMPEFSDITLNMMETNVEPFQKMKVMLKDEVITFKTEDLSLEERGEYLEYKQWDELIKRDDVILIDTRNYYEVAMGTFKGAIDPQIHHFSELPLWLDQKLKNCPKDKKIAMFCTGGIRCEKSTAYLKERGFQNVYHLKGGIIQYLANHDSNQNKWQGECFLFDDRVSCA